MVMVMVMAVHRLALHQAGVARARVVLCHTCTTRHAHGVCVRTHAHAHAPFPPRAPQARGPVFPSLTSLTAARIKFILRPLTAIFPALKHLRLGVLHRCVRGRGRGWLCEGGTCCTWGRACASGRVCAHGPATGRLVCQAAARPACAPHLRTDMAAAPTPPLVLHPQRAQPQDQQRVAVVPGGLLRAAGHAVRVPRAVEGPVAGAAHADGPDAAGPGTQQGAGAPARGAAGALCAGRRTAACVRGRVRALWLAH